MEAAELRQRRKDAGLTQAELGNRLGLHRDFVGLMERGAQPIADRTALAMLSLERATAAPPPPILLNSAPKAGRPTCHPVVQARATHRGGSRVTREHGCSQGCRGCPRMPPIACDLMRSPAKPCPVRYLEKRRKSRASRSYDPVAKREWWARRDSNPQPSRYERPALTIELQAHRLRPIRREQC